MSGPPPAELEPPYAEVAVDVPLANERGGRARPTARDATFHYAIPPDMRGRLRPGHRVWVPFGRRRVEGLVLALSPKSPVERTREILAVLDPEPLLGPADLALARWIGRYYLAPIFACLRLFLPPAGSLREERGYARSRTPVTAEALAGLSAEARAVLGCFGRSRRLSERQIERRAGPQRPKTLATLVAAGLLEPYERIVDQRPRRARRAPEPEPLAEADLGAPAAGFPPGPPEAALPGSPDEGLPEPEPAPRLGEDQAAAWERLAPLLEPAPTSSGAEALLPLPLGTGAIPPGRVGLLHGVTGSGKTELYLRAIERVLGQGQQALVLVPEIALSAQQLGRFARRFPGRVAVWHSQLGDRERWDTWQAARAGRIAVLVGSRSALFLPMPRLGLIVLDEEHADAYKQDRSPRYHAREVALRRAALHGAAVLMGSATPSIEAYRQARGGDWTLLELPRRLHPDGAGGSDRAELPEVAVVDMRAELRAGHTSIFSRALDAALATTLAAGEQAILFLNRRGEATFVLCRDCGEVLRCPRCRVPLTWHGSSEALVCHLCRRREVPPAMCPACGSPRIRYFGAGTERVEALARERFPGARILRWDADTSARRGQHAAILARFVAGEAEILVGTQMIAKGLDLPRVTLVGVVSADTNLHFPDFRASERSFQLLAQVAGRAGRSARGGRVILQTYSPSHPAIQCAARHDYAAFYRQELAFRAEAGYPPFRRLARLVHESPRGDRASAEATRRMAELLRRKIAELGIPEADVIGPAPAYFRYARGRARWHLILRALDPLPLLGDMGFGPGWRVDVDPIDLL